MRRIRVVAVFPTMFTLGNLVCGFFAIVVASRVLAPKMAALDPAGAMNDPANLMLSGYLIFVAMLFDALDGYVARLSRSASQFGKELDSLCDVVSFGVAPGFLLVKMCPYFANLHREAVWVIAAAYAACAALRLARFNVESGDGDDHLHFRGLPSPAAAAVIASFAIMFHTLRSPDELKVLYAVEINSAIQMILPFFGLLVALLMVSRIRYPHIVNQVFRGRRSFGHVVGVVFALVCILIIRGYAFPVISCWFALSGPVRYVWTKFVRRQPQQQENPLF